MEGCHAGIKIVKPRLVQRDEALVMGVEVRTSTRREMNPELAEIPKLWNRFLEEQLWLDILDPIHPEIFYGVYTDYASSDLDEYALILAIEVNNIDNPSESMVGLAIPAGKYLVFSSSNSSRAAVMHTWQQIWDYFSRESRHRRAFTTDFELYEQQQVSIYVAIR